MNVVQLLLVPAWQWPPLSWLAGGLALAQLDLQTHHLLLAVRTQSENHLQPQLASAAPSIREKHQAIAQPRMLGEKSGSALDPLLVVFGPVVESGLISVQVFQMLLR